MSRGSSVVTLALLTSAMLASCGGATPRAEPISLPPIESRSVPPAERAEAERPAELPTLAVRAFTASEQAGLQALAAKLSEADTDQRELLIDELERQFGGRGLVRVLAEVQAEELSSHETEAARRWFRTKQLFDRLEKLADPSCADDLHAWWSASKDEHWKGRAASILASMGDLRAATGLARRMRHAPEDLYTRDSFWQANAGGHLSRTDRPRIVAARLLADLAALHPAHLEHLRATAEQPVLAWMLKSPAPHANAMRFLALAGSNQGARQLSHWAVPSEPLPDVGAMPPFPRTFEIAQSALRYYGASRREGAYEVLIAQLERKPNGLNISQEALNGAGLAMRGMALRALTYGAAYGLAELGDERAHEALARILADTSHHEEARDAACRAVVWCLPPSTRQQMARRVLAHAGSADPVSTHQARCLASSLAQRPTPGVGEMLVSALERATTAELRQVIAAALAASDAAAVEDRLVALLSDDDVRATAAAALMLSGSPEGARRAANAAKDDPAAQDALYFVASAIGATDAHFEAGTFDRWGENWRAYAKESPWPVTSLQWFFDNVYYDTGPHTMTRIVLRRRLIHQALRGDDRQRENARTLLDLMREQGALWYVARHPPGQASGDLEEPTDGD